MSKRTRSVERALIEALDLVPKNTLSRAVGALAEVKLPGPMQRVVNESFARLARIDVSEAESMPGEYASLNAYFTRKLRPGARVIETREPDALTSPVDGRLTQHGSLSRGVLIQAKGREYSLVDLLDSASEARAFSQGWYATIYLSPRDYHRIHSPVAGEVSRVSYIPGHLWPVNPLSVRNVDQLFAVNERMISYLETEELGRVAVIKVGATCVGRIGLSYDTLETNGAFRRRKEMDVEPRVGVEHGDELGVFQLGSTVIVLIERDDFVFSPDLVEGQPVRLGQRLGQREPKA